jgi:hypothetical protein
MTSVRSLDAVMRVFSLDKPIECIKKIDVPSQDRTGVMETERARCPYNREGSAIILFFFLTLSAAIFDLIFGIAEQDNILVLCFYLCVISP